MQRETHFTQTVALPENFRQKLLDAPRIVQNRKHERSIWLMTICIFVAINIGLYQETNKQQQEAVAANYQYLTPTHLYP
ncbi:MAG: hypothetical protein ACKOWX_05190 [Flavobacteriales bacterium]